MKVKDLIKKLKTCDQESEVLLSSDSEGNNFNEISGLTIEDVGGIKSKEECICIWPI